MPPNGSPKAVAASSNETLCLARMPQLSADPIRQAPGWRDHHQRIHPFPSCRVRTAARPGRAERPHHRPPVRPLLKTNSNELRHFLVISRWRTPHAATQFSEVRTTGGSDAPVTLRAPAQDHRHPGGQYEERSRNRKMEAAWNPGTANTYRIGGGSVIEIHTDQGLSGLGPAIDSGALELCRAQLIGRDPFNIEQLAGPLRYYVEIGRA